MTQRETRISPERLAELIEDRWEIGEDVCHSGWKNDQYHDITRALRELAATRRVTMDMIAAAHKAENDWHEITNGIDRYEAIYRAMRAALDKEDVCPPPASL